jgi:hypothetical protein
MFIEDLQKLYLAKVNKGEALESINLCENCLKLVTKEIQTREYTSKGRPGHMFKVSKLFGKPILKDIYISSNNGFFKEYEKCLKHGLVLLPSKDNEDKSKSLES